MDTRRFLSVMSCIGWMAGCAAETGAMSADDPTVEADAAEAEVAASEQALRSGLETTAIKSATRPDPYKELIAWCKPGRKVVGGGAFVDDRGRYEVRLTKLEPLNDHRGSGYLVRAEAPRGFDESWTLDAYALCGEQPHGWEIKFGDSREPTSKTFKHAEAVCSPGKKVIGTGAAVYGSNQEVGLQMTRAAGPLDISRAAAREDADGYHGSWALRAYAICIDAIPGQESRGVVHHGQGTYAECPSGSQVHSVGGGAGPTSDSGPDVGPVFLHIAYPFSNRRGFQTYMTGAPVGGMVATAVCAR